MHTMSQQQVTPQQMVNQIGHVNPQSESAMLSQQVSNLQSHRPHVPHSGREFSPQKNAQSVPANPASHGAATSQQGSGGGSASEQMGEQGNAKNEKSQPTVEEDTYERQPVGGRNAALYRQLVMENRQQQAQQQPDAQFPGNSHSMNQFAVLNQANNQHGYNHVLTYANIQNAQNSPQNPQSVQNPQQLYQQMQQNMAQQQHMQQRAMNYQMQMMKNQRCQTAPPNYSGMTSSQDAITTQMRNLRMMGSNYPVQDHNTVNAANGLYRNSNNANNTNNTTTANNSNQLAEYSSVKAQLKSYNVDVVNGNQTLYRPQNQQQQQQQQFMPHYQPEIGYQQQMQPQQQMQAQPFQQQLYRNPVMQGHQNMMVYNQPGYNQQISPGQQMIPMIRQQNLENNPERIQGQHGRKRALKFTHGMIRDQEKLLATMKQQRVPIDIMKRQFEMLLNEQRKHLEYLEQQNNMLEEVKPVVVTRKRKQQDEKPEWMIHLTPPRLSYLEIERMQEQRRKEREMEMMQQQQQQQQQQYQQQYQTMDEMSRQQVPVQAINQQNYQHYREQANWQQQQKTSRQYNSARPYAVPGPGNVNESIKTMKYQQQNVPQYHHQYQQSHHQQPYQHAHQHLQPHQEYYNPQQYQQYQQYYQALAQQQNREHVQPIATNQLYEDQNRPSTEPSSLLKIRRYRNEIRPQRRNNGLQEPEMAKRQLEEFRISAEIRKGLEYIANLAPKKRVVRLNGMQESNELDSQFQQRLITSALPQSVQRISANGLENTRNPNNPPSQRLSNLKKMEYEYLREYPRQKQNNPRTCYSVPAERENGSMAMDQQQQQQLQQMQHQILSQQQFPVENSSKSLPYNENSQLLPRVNSTSYRFDANYPQHYQQMQQYYQNSKNLARNHGEGDMGSTQRIEQNKGNFDHAGGDASENMNNTTMNGQMADGKIPYQKMYYSQPDIHESRMIGGVRYLARKQDYMPNQ